MKYLIFFFNFSFPCVAKLSLDHQSAEWGCPAGEEGCSLSMGRSTVSTKHSGRTKANPKEGWRVMWLLEPWSQTLLQLNALSSSRQQSPRLWAGGLGLAWFSWDAASWFPWCLLTEGLLLHTQASADTKLMSPLLTGEWRDVTLSAKCISHVSGLSWKGGRDHPAPAPVIGRDLSTQPGCSKPHPAWPWAIPGTVHHSFSGQPGNSSWTFSSSWKAGEYCCVDLHGPAPVNW